MKKTILSFGVILLAVVTVLSSCKKEEPTPVTPTPSTPGGGGSGSSYFISYTINGTAVSQVNGTSGFNHSVSTGGQIDAPNNTIQVSSSASMYFWNLSGGNDESSSISFGDYGFALNTYSSDKPAALASIFTLGTHVFENYASGADGVSFSVLDSNGDSWTTAEVTQGANASFTITESVAAVINNEYVRKVRGTFENLTVSDGAGTTKTVTGGSFYLYFEAY